MCYLIGIRKNLTVSEINLSNIDVIVNSMGALCSQTSTKTSQLNRTNESPISLLGHRQTSTNSPPPPPLSVTPDSNRIWDLRLQSPLPRATPLFDQSVRISDLSSPYPIEMSTITDLKYKCDQCGMVFPSNENLFKHKTRFCIGVKDSGIGRKPVFSDDEESNDLPYTTRKKVIRHQSPPKRVRSMRKNYSLMISRISVPEKRSIV